MCATDLRPTSIVGGKGFKKVMFKMNPDYHVPTPATINKYLGVAYDEEVKVLINAIQGKDVAVTTDLWTSVGQRSYITVTGHHINSEWELKANILATKTVDDRHTGEKYRQTCIYGYGSLHSSATSQPKTIGHFTAYPKQIQFYFGHFTAYYLLARCVFPPAPGFCFML